MGGGMGWTRKIQVDSGSHRARQMSYTFPLSYSTGLVFCVFVCVGGGVVLYVSVYVCGSLCVLWCVCGVCVSVCLCKLFLVFQDLPASTSAWPKGVLYHCLAY